MISPLEHMNEFNPGQFYKEETKDSPKVKTMTIQGVMLKTCLCLAVLSGGFYAGMSNYILGIPAVAVALILGLIIWLASIKNPVLVLLFSLAVGMMLGAIVGLVEFNHPGVATLSIAMLGSLLIVVLGGYSMNLFHANLSGLDAYIRIMICYLLFGLAATVLALSGALTNLLGSVLLVICVVVLHLLGLGLSAYSLILNFDFIENGVINKLETEWEWLAVFALIGSLAWCYLEILHLLWWVGIRALESLGLNLPSSS